jgi:hypothetical protein
MEMFIFVLAIGSGASSGMTVPFMIYFFIYFIMGLIWESVRAR